MQKKYSWYSLLKAGFANQDWDKAIPSSKPKSKYDIIIVGGGGHGLATAYYLAKECGIANVAAADPPARPVPTTITSIPLLLAGLTSLISFLCLDHFFLWALKEYLILIDS